MALLFVPLLLLLPLLMSQVFVVVLLPLLFGPLHMVVPVGEVVEVVVIVW